MNTFLGKLIYVAAFAAALSGKSDLHAQNKPLEQDTVSLAEIMERTLSEVVVTGYKRQVVYKLDKQVIEAAGFLSAAGGTAADILMQTPSIRVDAEGEITFRGSSGFKVYIDGKPSALPYPHL
ncbi:MAG: hypothetical protein LBF39_02315 [Prevotellaceae bacterium]|nr:hypothetical protein [Prevotellaceae bacterium]